MEWEIVIGCIAALVGLFVTVGKPIIGLNQTITKLNVTLQNIERRVDGHDAAIKDQERKAKASHERIWDHNEKQDEQLQDHERRIFALENKEE